MNLDNISADEARQLFAYDPNTGVITRRFSAGGCPSGSVAGWINSEGYVSLRLFGKACKAHRFAWLLHYGVWPSKQIDHINGVRHDNRILNLREASRAENAWNRQTQTNNASGYKGVSWHRSSRKWVAQIRGNGTKKHIGLFDTPAEAHAAYRAAAINYHGEFANDGRATHD